MKDTFPPACQWLALLQAACTGVPHVLSVLVLDRIGLLIACNHVIVKIRKQMLWLGSAAAEANAVLPNGSSVFMISSFFYVLTSGIVKISEKESNRHILDKDIKIVQYFEQKPHA